MQDEPAKKAKLRKVLDTRGRSRLLVLLEEKSQKEIADALKPLHQSSVSLWASGRSRPEPPQRRALALLFGIPEDDWLTNEEAAVVARAELKAEKGAA